MEYFVYFELFRQSQAENTPSGCARGFIQRFLKKSVDKGASLLQRRQTVEQFGILFTCCAEIHHDVAVDFREGLPDTFREIDAGFMTYFDAQVFLRIKTGWRIIAEILFVYNLYDAFFDHGCHPFQIKNAPDRF